MSTPGRPESHSCQKRRQVEPESLHTSLWGPSSSAFCTLSPSRTSFRGSLPASAELPTASESPPRNPSPGHTLGRGPAPYSICYPSPLPAGALCVCALPKRVSHLFLQHHHHRLVSLHCPPLIFHVSHHPDSPAFCFLLRTRTPSVLSFPIPVAPPRPSISSSSEVIRVLRSVSAPPRNAHTDKPLSAVFSRPTTSSGL